MVAGTRGFPHFLQLYSCCYSLFLSHAPVYCCIAVYRLCSNILPLSRKKNTIKIRQSPAMTTINLALTLIPVTLCTAGYAELLEVLISATALTHASFFPLTLEAMVLSVVMLNLDFKLSRPLSTFAHI